MLNIVQEFSDTFRAGIYLIGIDDKCTFLIIADNLWLHAEQSEQQYSYFYLQPQIWTFSPF